MPGSPSLLVSFQNAAELLVCGEDAPSWLDLKNPSRGPLGCPELDQAEDFLEAVRMLPTTAGRRTTSLALGELHERSWSGMEAVIAKFDYAKVALSACEPDRDWPNQLEPLRSMLSQPSRLVLTYYADRSLAGCPDWTNVIQSARTFGSQYLLIDTFDKAAGRLWTWLSRGELQDMIAQAQAAGLQVALAGSLKLGELGAAFELGAEIVGVRGAVCEFASRLSPISRDKVIRAAEEVRSACRAMTTGMVT
jgi:(5-formylfuran-3-yl)methyl phosphate synthase